MANLRIVYDNAADRASTLVASTTAGALAAANLQMNSKSTVWRSTGTTASLSLTWAGANPEKVACVVLPFSSLSPTATMRVRLYSDTGGSTLLIDSGTHLCCGSAPHGLADPAFLPSGANGYSYGGGVYACAWVAPTESVRKAVIDIVDTDNPLGYIEAARLVVGDYWSPTINASAGVTLTMVDTSAHARTDAGDLLTANGTRHKKLTFDLPAMAAADRSQIISIMRVNGMPRPIYCSIFPENGDLDLEQDFQVFGKLMQMPGIGTPIFSRYATALDVEEV